VTGAESSAAEASVRIQLEGAIPEIVSGRFEIDTLVKNLSIAMGRYRKRKGPTSLAAERNFEF
jgi:hypothetical protein